MKPSELFAYVKEAYGTEPERMWTKWPNYAVLRNDVNRRWYGVVMDVPPGRLGLEGTEPVFVLNVKVDPDDALVLRMSSDIMPAYHMNKKNWVSVRLDGELPDAMIVDLIDMSRRLTS